MPDFKRTMHPPPGRRGFKIPDYRATLPLTYLGWGSRRFGEDPIPLSMNFGWVYGLVLEGRPILLVQDTRIKTAPGSAFVFGSDCAMGWEDTRKAHSQILIWIWESPPSIPSIQPNNSTWLQWNASKEKLDNLERNHRDCRRELAQPDKYTSEALNGLQQQLDVEWARNLVETSANQEPLSRYATGLNWMRYNLNASHPVGELAIYLEVSEATLQRIFKRHTGHGPLAVFQELKLKTAERLLKERTPVKAIAFQLGYKHPNDFTRFFTKATGHPPSSIR